MLFILKSKLDFDSAMSAIAVPDAVTEHFVLQSEICSEERVFLDVRGQRCGGRLIATDHHGRPVGVAIYISQGKELQNAEIAVNPEFEKSGARARDGMNEVVIISGLTQSLLRLCADIATV